MGPVLVIPPQRLVRAHEPVTEVSFCIMLYEVYHANIIRIPEVAGSTRYIAGHPEMVDVSGGIHLTWHANLESIWSIASVITVCLVVSRTNHIWFACGNDGELVISS